MTLNMPNSPTDGEIFVATNGISYSYDLATDRWLVTVEAADGINLWARDVADEEIYPIYYGDSVVIKNDAEADAIDLDPAVGVTLSSGLKFIGQFEIDSLTTLP